MSARNAGRKTAGDRPVAVSSAMIPWRDPRLLAALLLLAVAAVTAAWVARGLGTPADLLAVWVAGEFWQMGRLGEIYPPADGLFTLLPPAGWADWLAVNLDDSASVYPYLYPPLWAALMGTFAPADFAVVAEASYWINAGLLAATVALAIRAAGAPLQPVLHVVLVLVIFLTTHIASVGFLQGQPHILVAFLIVLAIERSRAGAPVAAGTALALAASIKLFPLIYAVVWLARGERRALGAFALAGAALALASVLLAGWPLHAAFLDSVRQIGRTLLLIGNSLSFDAVVGKLFLADTAQAIPAPDIDSTDGAYRVWRVAPRPLLWAATANAGLLAVLAGAAYAARRLPADALYAGVWPALLAFSVLFTPTGWIYYAIPVAVFAPTLVAGRGDARGLALFAVGLLLFYSGRLELFKGPGAVRIDEVFFYLTGTFAWGLGFARVAHQRSHGAGGE